MEPDLIWIFPILLFVKLGRSRCLPKDVKLPLVQISGLVRSSE